MTKKSIYSLTFLIIFLPFLFISCISTAVNSTEEQEITSTQTNNMESYYSDTFDQYIEENNIESASKTLDEWATITPKSANWYCSAMILYKSMGAYSISENVIPSKPNDDILYNIIKDPQFGIFYSIPEIKTNKEYLDKLINYAHEGINLYPNRLDLRQGLIYSLNDILDFTNAKAEIINLINYSAEINTQWLKYNNTAYNGGDKSIDLTIRRENYFINIIGEILYKWCQPGTIGIPKDALEVAKLLHEKYPNNSKSNFLLGTIYISNDDLENASKYIDIAFTLDPTDVIIIANRAKFYLDFIYNHEKAVECVNALIAINTDESINFAFQLADLIDEAAKNH